MNRACVRVHTWPCLLFTSAGQDSALLHLVEGARPRRPQGCLCPALGLRHLLSHTAAFIIVHMAPQGMQGDDCKPHTAAVLLDWRP